MVREIQVLAPCEGALLTDRYLKAPAGARGGKPARPGRAWLVSQGRSKRLGSKVCLKLLPGDSLRIATPGGGGWGRKK